MKTFGALVALAIFAAVPSQSAIVDFKVYNSGAQVAKGDPNCSYEWTITDASTNRVMANEFLTSPVDLPHCKPDQFTLILPENLKFIFMIDFKGHGSYYLDVKGIPTLGANMVPNDIQPFMTE